MTLVSGQVIDLNNYEAASSGGGRFAGFLIGVAWMLYWTLSNEPSPTSR